jgi:hypothetical protein
MSPEQCRGGRLDARSDIYNLGLIAYQMIAGTLPFTGDAILVLRAHRECQPKPLYEHDRKLPKNVSRLVMSALEKDPAARPQTALAFANALRANADGLGVLYRRAFALYSEYFPQMFKLSVLAHIPVIAVLLMTIAVRLGEARLGELGKIALKFTLGLLNSTASFITASTISGVTAIIVTQLAVTPLKVMELGPAFAILRRHWPAFLKTGLIASLRIFLGIISLVIPGVVMMVRYSLWAPVVLLEGLEKKRALERSRALVARSWTSIILAMLLQFLLPKLVDKMIGVSIDLDSGGKDRLHVQFVSQWASLTSILFLPLLSIVPALLYLKMRQLGGEPLTQIELEVGRSTWEQPLRLRPTAQRP